ncbi:MAG: hypothetical protein KC544_07455 [Gemmatimonadetes bacterium]|nr:hypothetical protein [Gemmatimonadota bacterium]
MSRQDQAPQRPTVGDTLTVVQRVPAPAGALVQPRLPDDSLVATVLGVPSVQREGDSVRIAYTVTVWAPGRHELRLPGALVLGPDGAVDTLADARVLLDVASVLPEGEPVESLAPRNARPWMPRAERSAVPFAVLLLPLLVLVLITAWWWRRRGPVTPRPMREPPTRADQIARIARWIEAEEVALAVDHLARMLPEGPDGESWRARVAEVRFAAGMEGTLDDLAREGLELAGRPGGAS